MYLILDKFMSQMHKLAKIFDKKITKGGGHGPSAPWFPPCSQVVALLWLAVQLHPHVRARLVHRTRSMALSGKCRPMMYHAERCTAATMAWSSMCTPWCPHTYPWIL